MHYGILLPEAAVKLEGELTSYEKVADSGKKITREFCPTCGSGVTNRLEMAPGMIVVKGGTIDEVADRPKPTFALYTDSQCAWLTSDLRSFEREPDAPMPELMWKP